MVFRSSKSCWTVSFSKPVTKMFCAFSKSFLSASRSFCLSDFFFMLDSPLQLLRVVRGHVQMNARPHGGADGDALDVLAFGRGRLGFDDRLNQATGVLDQLGRVEIDFSYRNEIGRASCR